MRRVVLIVLGLLGLAAGATALAQSGGDDYQLQEPSITSRQVLRLPSDASCVHFTRATIRFLPPRGAVFGLLRVTADGAEAARLTGVPRAASATIRLRGARTAVRASGTTLGGQNIAATRHYRRCGTSTSRPRSKPRAKPTPTAPPTQVGGGEDG